MQYGWENDENEDVMRTCLLTGLEGVESGSCFYFAKPLGI
jgi:hypothetical protein